MPANWGDEDGDDDFDGGMGGQFDNPDLPAQSHFRSKIFSSTSDGIKTITEYRTDERTGKKQTIIRKLKITKKIVKRNPEIIRRRKLAKFGDCKGQPLKTPEDGIVSISPDMIALVLRCRKKEDDEEEDDLAKLKAANVNDSVVVCRNCGEQGHWTLKCPKRNKISVTMKDGTAITDAPGGGALGGGTGKYVPLHKRAGASSAGSKYKTERDDSATLRVTNISEDATEDDLRELFRPFGYISRIYLAKDPYTRQSRCFAFISYANRTQAVAAIQRLNGYGYDNLILNVEFAKPRVN